jgi:hypothetical protein
MAYAIKWPLRKTVIASLLFRFVLVIFPGGDSLPERYLFFMKTTIKRILFLNKGVFIDGSRTEELITTRLSVPIWIR